MLALEPMVGPVDMRQDKPQTNARLPSGVIVGGENGPGAAPLDPAWVRVVRDQCAAAGVPFFFKGWGGWGPAESIHGFDRPGWYEEDPQDGGLPRKRFACTNREVWKVGKKHSGRLLDGRTHDALPWGGEVK